MEDYLTASLEEYADQRRFLESAFKKIEALPEQTQRVIRLRAEGFSYNEIAKIIGVQENSARVIEFRGKNQLRTLLKKEDFI